MRTKVLSLLAVLILLAIGLTAQQPAKPSSGEIYESIRKLDVLGSALYIAAHPDDENTRLISYLSNEEKLRTGYLSLTRGDGGQNLVGPEIRELLGVIRTQELLAARRIDGGRQFFTRANDFGYSKHPEETLQIWDHDEVLADVVWTIRKFRPDIIVNRFDHRTPGRTHGHHTSSAMLSVEAFDLAGDPEAYPEQLAYVEPWQPGSLFFNTSWWFYGSQENFDKADKSRMMSVDVGVYYPILGKSNTEIASDARTMHKTQGFGSTGSRGSRQEYLQLIKGDLPSDKSTIASGMELGWAKVKGGQKIADRIDEILETYDFTDPSASVPALAELYDMMSDVEDDHWRTIKKDELARIIYWASGLYIEAITDKYQISPGEGSGVDIEIVNRSGADVQLRSIRITNTHVDTLLALDMEKNREYLLQKRISVPEDAPYSSPYWLEEEGSLGMYKVPRQEDRGRPVAPAYFRLDGQLKVSGVEIPFSSDLKFKRNDPVDGESYRPLEIVPPVAVNILESAYIFGDDRPREVELTVQALRDSVNGILDFSLPDGWQIEPSSFDLALSTKGESDVLKARLKPPSKASDGHIKAAIRMGGDTYDKSIHLIEYDYLPTQTVFMPAMVKVVRIDLEKRGRTIGYIEGAGDAIPASLHQIGYEVDMIDPSVLGSADLDGYDAIITGIRAFNTVEPLKYYTDRLNEYVKNGGTVIVQYNTSHRLVTRDIGPYPLTYSRDRVADETAEITILEPDHEVFQAPNKITAEDFDNWVQERGLYFPDEWDERWTPLLSCHDPGESAKTGGLLVAEYGKGHFIYTGYSWFRQLPAGVPGAFRLFTNLISIGKKDQP